MNHCKDCGRYKDVDLFGRCGTCAEAAAFGPIFEVIFGLIFKLIGLVLMTSIRVLTGLVSSIRRDIRERRLSLETVGLTLVVVVAGAAVYVWVQDHHVRLPGSTKVRETPDETPLLGVMEFVVPADLGGGVEGPRVSQGSRIEVVATGEWSAGGEPVDPGQGRHPDPGENPPVAPQALIGSLIGRLATAGSDGEWFPIGGRVTLTIESDGILWFAMNDLEGTYSDNFGEVVVRVATAP